MMRPIRDPLAGKYKINDNDIIEEAVVLNSLTPVSKSDVSKILPDVSPTTIESVLGQMVKSGAIRKIGSGKATKYVKN